MTSTYPFYISEKDVENLRKYSGFWLDEGYLSDKQTQYLMYEFENTDLLFGGVVSGVKTYPTYIEPLICNEQRPSKTKELKKLKPKHSQPFWSNNWRKK